MIPDFPFQYSNLLFLLIPIGKALVDVYLFEKRNIPVRHNESLLVAVIVGLIFASFDFFNSPVQYYFQPCLLAIGTHWLIFDYLRNILAGKNFFYVDGKPESDTAEDSWWDVHFYSKLTPLTLLFSKCWFLLVSVSFYYYLSYII